MSVHTAPPQDLAAGILDRVQELAPGFRSRAATTDAERTIPAESIRELVDAGLARMLVPTRYGGSDLGIRDAVDTTMAVAAGCASTGWISWLMMHVPHMISMFPAEAQDAVWADGPDVVTAGSHLGMAVTPVEGGYRISGRGAFTSGVNNAEWVYVGGLLPGAGGPPQLRYFLLRRDQYTVEDTWDTIGMRGTGSNTVVVEDLFVPAAYTLDHADAREGTGPGATLSDNPALRQPWVSKGSLGFLATAIGATQASLDHVAASLAEKKAPSGFRVAESEVLQMDVGLVSAKIDTARTLLRAHADSGDSTRTFTLADRAAMARNSSLAIALVLEAMDKLLELAGTSGFGTGALVQQSWRDVHFAASHVSLGRREPWARYGRVLLGVQEKAPGMFF